MRSRPSTGKLFRFEAMWLCDSRSEAWECGLAMSMGYPIKNGLQSCTDALTRWNKEEFGHVGRRISSLKT